MARARSRVPMVSFPVQSTLPGFADLAPRPPRRRGRRGIVTAPHTEDRLLATYLRRLRARGVAPKGFAAYRYQLRTLARIAGRLAGHRIALDALFQDPM